MLQSGSVIYIASLLVSVIVSSCAVYHVAGTTALCCRYYCIVLQVLLLPVRGAGPRDHHQTLGAAQHQLPAATGPVGGRPQPPPPGQLGDNRTLSCEMNEEWRMDN